MSAPVEADLVRALAVAGRHSDAAPEELAAVLYQQWYAPAIDVAERPREPPLFGQYRSVHAGAESWLRASVVSQAPGGIVVARVGGNRPRALLSGDYASTTRTGLAPQPGEELRITARQDAPPAEGWWRTWGGGWRPDWPPERLTRIYLAVDAEHVLTLIAVLTALLLGRREPWLLKVAADRGALGRPDAAVLYLPSAELGEAPAESALILAVADGVAGLVRNARPALALPVRTGVALAEDPADGQSFGEHRCGVFAQALAGGGASSVAGLRNALGRAGIDPGAPHLRAVVRA